MNRFNFIDNKLLRLASKLNATLRKDRPNFPQTLRTFEERRLDWRDIEIRKAIIIQPTFEATGVNSAIWNFINIAWHHDALSRKTLKWKKILVDKSDFEVIEKNIDELLRQSEENLKKIVYQDLK